MRCLTDEDFDNDILRGVLNRRPEMDVLRVQDVGLDGQPDPNVLEWAAEQERVLLTHDVNTLLAEAYARIAAGQRMPGLVVVPQGKPLARVIEDLVLLFDCSRESEWEGHVWFVPLQS